MLHRIVLVHGAWHGAWCWEHLTPSLEARRFEVDTLDLPGLGADQTPATDVTLDAYIDRVVSVVNAGRLPVLLAGHSMGGMVISGVAERIPAAIGKLVYLTALLPRDGESLVDVASVGTDGAATAALEPNAADGAHLVDRSVAADLFYNCCSPELADHAAQRLRPQSLRPLLTPLRLSADRWGRIPMSYILCTQDHALPLRQQQALCDRRPGIKKIVVDADHSPFYSTPQRLAETLDMEARS